MANQLHLMNAGRLLSPEVEAEVRRVAQDTLDTCAEQLALDGVDVALYVTPWTLPETGVGGYAPLPHGVQVTLTPTNPHFEAGWRVEVPATLAHELHHARRWRGPGYGITLLEVLVTEGLAQHFEHVFRGAPPLYATIDADLDALWHRAPPELEAPTYDHAAWFYGLSAQQLPRWAGYALGFELMRRFFAQQGGDAPEGVDLPARDVRRVWPSPELTR